MRRIWPLKHSAKQQFPLKKLVHDLLCLVLEQVDASDLCNLCLVSRDLYRRVVPLLYRDLDLTFSKGSHRRLLVRLGHPLSTISSHIRTISIEDPEHLDDAQLQSLHSVFMGLKNLKHLKYQGPLFIPVPLLDLIHHNHPGATLDIEDWINAEFEITAEDPISPRTVLAHPIGTQMTRFCFTPFGVQQLYPNFKLDLIKMLQANRGITKLELNFLWIHDYEFPEYGPLLRGATLPQLTLFILDTWVYSFFTRRELSIWGDKDGWEKLSVLRLRCTTLFAAFYGRTPALEDLILHVYTATGVQGMDAVEETLEATGVADPFPQLRRVQFVAEPSVMVFPNRRLVPLGVLKWMPNITSLDLHIEGSVVSPLTLPQWSPTAQEIQSIRTMCPNLEDFGLDIVLLGRSAKWPMDIVEELCRFEKPIELSLYIHREETRRAKIKKWLVDFWRIACDMRRKRERYALPWDNPFQIHFKLASPIYGVEPSMTRSAVNFHTCLGGFTIIYWYKYRTSEDDLDEMGVEELQKKKARQFSNMFGWDRKGYGKELEKRRRDADAVVKDTDYPTLYDAWTQ